jgi:sec-independent protein translocase protein TatA
MIVLVLVVIVFGVGKLPEIGGALGRGIKEFRSATDDPKDDKAADQSKTTKDSV